MFEKLLGFLKIQKFSSELQLLDGTLIRIDGIFGDADVPVNLVTSDGLKPLPDDDYQLGGDYEGTIITVKDGIIVDFNKVKEEDVEDVVKEPDDKVEEEVAAADEVVAPTTDEAPVDSDPISALEKKLDDLIKSMDPMADLQSRFEELVKRVDALEGKDTNMTTELSTMKTLLEKMDGAKPLKKNIVPVDDPIILDNPRYNAIKNKNKK